MTFTALIPAESGWKALYGKDGVEAARSRIVAWAVVEADAKMVGVVVDPSNPTKLVAAPDVVDPDGNVLMRYGYAGAPTVSARPSPGEQTGRLHKPLAGDPVCVKDKNGK